jgi:hypothetical protein
MIENDAARTTYCSKNLTKFNIPVCERNIRFWVVGWVGNKDSYTKELNHSSMKDGWPISDYVLCRVST